MPKTAATIILSLAVLVGIVPAATAQTDDLQQNAPQDELQSTPQEQAPEPPPDTVRPAARELVIQLDTTARTNIDRQRAIEGATATGIAAQQQLEFLDQVLLPAAEERFTLSTKDFTNANDIASQAAAAASQAENRLRDYAVAVYMYGNTTPSFDFVNEFYLTSLRREIVGNVDQFLKDDLADSVTAKDVAQQQLSQAQAMQSQMQDELMDLRNQRTELLTSQNNAAASLTQAQALPQVTPDQVAAIQNELLSILSANGIPANSAFNPGLSILGPSTLSAEALWGWYQGQGYTKDVREIINLYLDEGTKLGVRGDVAFFQGVLETGGFTSLGASYFNFAGVGHCDSCPNGFPYPDARTGVRAQITLLRAYADETVTTQQLPDGPVPYLNIDTLGVKGCCATWWGLTGVWATALHYGGSILKMYDSAILASLP